MEFCLNKVNRRFHPKKHIKSIIYGGLDGIITIFAMVASTSGASLSAALLLIIGVANLVADAFSMSVSDFLSSKAEKDYNETSNKKILKGLDEDLDHYKGLVFELYCRKGFTPEDSQALANILAKDKKTLAEILVREDQEKDDDELSPSHSAFWTFGSFMLFGSLPLLTYILSPSVSAQSSTSEKEREQMEFWMASLLTSMTLLGLGFMKAKFTNKEFISSGLEMLLLGGAAAAMAYAIARGLS